MHNLRVVLYNCRFIKSRLSELYQLCENSDICLIQEHWLMKEDLPILSTVHSKFHGFGVSAIDSLRY